MRVSRWPAGIALAFLAACSRPSVEVDPGVSLALAQERSGSISNLRYRLHFDIPDNVNAAIDADATIRFSRDNTDRPVILDFREKREKIGYITINGRVVDYEFRNEHIILAAGLFNAGENTIRVEFIAGDSSLNRNPDYLYTLFVPDRARTAFPLFDQPDLKALWELELELPAGWTAMSNAPVSRVHYGATRTVYRFEESDLLSSYLFSFVAGRFERVLREVDGRYMTMLHRETDGEAVSRNVDEIFRLHAAAIAWLEDYTGIGYPYKKFGFALIPAFQYGGMEHVGAIQYRAASLFLDEAPSETQLLGRAGLIAHETAHMWFGDLVTMKWFNDVWTKEVFANFMAAKIVNPSFPDVNHDLNFLVRHYPAAYAVDRTGGANPIRQFLPNLNEAGQMYGNIIYNKAPIMMRHLEAMIGEEAFRDGMREYLSTYAFSNATWPDLIGILDQKSDENLRAWSRVWVDTPGRSAIQARWEAAGEDSGFFRYGLVSADPNDLESSNELARAAALINLYEQMLAGNEPGPEQHFDRLLVIAATETDPLVLDLALDQLRQVFWRLLSGPSRDERAEAVERVLWDALLRQEDPSRRKMYFAALSDVATTPDGLDRIRRVFTGEEPMDRLPLSENESIELACDLAVKWPGRADEIMAFQAARTENPDNVRRLAFIEPSVSADPAVRDAFFSSLADPGKRETEAWVLEALANLHHPVRTESSEKYIRPSLELLKEIQVTGDIFFPKRWLDATLGNYRSDSAVSEVRTFLADNPDYNEQLRMKILQAADMMFRANRLADDTDRQ